MKPGRDFHTILGNSLTLHKESGLPKEEAIKAALGHAGYSMPAPPDPQDSTKSSPGSPPPPSPLV